MSVAETLRTGVQLASAVETAHRAGVLHRDIKPANVLVSSYGHPALADFGVAGRAATAQDDTEVGVSLAWAPPEVLQGHSSGSVRADVYSLTATLFYLLTGHTPFEASGGDNSDTALTVRTLHEPPRATGRDDVPASLEQLLRRGLAKDPSMRPESALALGLELQRVEAEMSLPRTELVVLDEHEDLHTATGSPTTVRAAGGPSAATPVQPVALGRPTHTTPRRWPWVLLAAAAASLLAAGAVVAALLLDSLRSTEEPAAAPSSAQTGSSSSPSAASPEPSASQSPEETPDPATGSEIDPCLVGSWETVRHEEPVPLVGTLTDLQRTMDFTADGRLTITYDDARPKGAGSGMVFDGTVVYEITTSDGRMSFDLIEDDLDVTASGMPVAAGPGTSAVDYTCEGDTFTESGNGMDAEYRRADGVSLSTP